MTAATTALAAKDCTTDAPADAQVVVDWNTQALDTARALSLSDAQAARTYGMLNAAMYDAVHGILSGTGDKRQQALVPSTGAPKNADVCAAAAAAGHALMTQLFPSRAAIYDAKYTADLALINDGQRKTDGMNWGTSVGNAVVALRTSDGSTPTESQAAGSAIGEFRAAWSGTQFRHLAPLAIVDPSVYVSDTRPSLGSTAYSDAFNEVKTLGNAAVPDAQALATFQFWNSPGGSVQAPGEWIKVASQLSLQQGLAIGETTRLLTLLGMALSDVVAPTFTIKFNTHAWRPTTAIREADADGNPLTAADTLWSPRGGSIGGTPEHVSGHSSFAGAATTVMRGFFCDDNMAFSLQTDSAPAGPRSYASFTQAETEAGRSRVLGGLHFEFSNQGGLLVGRGVGAEVLARALLRTVGQTHQGTCPK